MKPQARYQLFAAALVTLSVGTLAYANPAIAPKQAENCPDASPAIGTMDIAWREPLR